MDKRFQHVLLTSDVDATFFWKEAYVHPYNLERVRYFIDNGGRFSFSSGRNHRDIFLILPNLGEYVNAPCVLCNGAFLYDAQTGAISNPKYLEAEAAVRLIREVRRRLPWARFRISCAEGFLVPEGEADVFTSKQHNLLSLATFRDIRTFDGHAWFKMVFPGEHEKLEEILALMTEIEADAFTYCYSDPNILEVLPRGVSKATQLNWLRERLRRDDPELQLWCVGDYDNDEDMLRCADVAACPSNATQRVQSICQIHLRHCQDGAVGQLIDEIERRVPSL